jgi:hypothetical protein
MHAIGVDYQRTLAVICLREGPCSTAKIRSVGDGLRHLIPTAVLNEKQWGSAAMLAADPKRLCGNSHLADDPWLDELGATLFWRGLYRRLYTYLGYIQPTEQSGYRLVVSLPAAGYELACEQITHFCQVVGLRDPTIIPLTDAILSRWMTEQMLATSGESVVAVAAIGDTSSSVRAYRIHAPSSGYPRILSASRIVSLAETGQAWWIQNILRSVETRLGQSPPPELELGLRDAAIELGMRLGSAAAKQAIAWAGPLQKHLFTPLQWTRQECTGWPEVSRLANALPIAIRDTVTSIEDRSTPDMLLVGGVGAVWPFARDIAIKLIAQEKIWQSFTPQEDGAWGAACWPKVGAGYTDILFQQTSMPVERTRPDREESQVSVVLSSYEEVKRIAQLHSGDSQPSVDMLPTEAQEMSIDQYALESYPDTDFLYEVLPRNYDLSSDVYPSSQQ